MQGEAGPAQTTVEVLEAQMRGPKKGNFFSIFAITAPPLLPEAGSEQGRQNLRASTAVQTYAASSVQVCD